MSAKWVVKHKRQLTTSTHLAQNIILKYHLLLFYATIRNFFLNGLWHVMKRGLISSNALPTAKLAPWKVMFPVWGYAGRLIHHSSLNPVKPLHLRSRFSTLIRFAGNCSTRSQLWSTERAPFPVTTPSRTLPNQCFRRWMNWATKLGLISIISWPLTSRLALLQTSQPILCREMFPQPAGCRKCFPRVCWTPKHRCLGYRNKLAKCVDCNYSYFG